MKGSNKLDDDLEQVKSKKLDKEKVLNLRKKRKQKDDERNPKDKPARRK